MDGLEDPYSGDLQEAVAVGGDQGSLALSVIILSYNVRDLLALAIRTARAAAHDIDAEIIVVDNDSADGSAEMVEERFPDVTLIRSGGNIGFAAGNNVGMREARGRYVLLLNPDVLVHPNAFKTLVAYLDAHPGTGAAGGRIIRPDGTPDPSAKRGFPSPSAAFYRMVGLSYLFPRSSRFGRYNLTFMDDESQSDVDALSGCFMCVRREVIDAVGGLDEEFFMYGEDLDWSYRIREAGWKIAYLPDAEIVHFKGESTRSLPKFRQLYEFHRAMHLFVKKHIAKKQNPVVLGLIEAGIFARGIGVTIWRFGLAVMRPVFDSILLVLAVILALRTRMLTGWEPPPFKPVEWLLIGAVFFGAGALGALIAGLYRRGTVPDRLTDAIRAFTASAIGGAACVVAVFFIKTINFSRIVTGLAWIYTAAFTAGWRWFISPRGGQPRGRGLVLGTGTRAERFLRQHGGAQRDYRVMGVVRARGESADIPDVAGFPVLAEMEDLPMLLRRLKVDDLIIAWEDFQYRDVLTLARRGGGYPRRVRLVPAISEEPLVAENGNGESTDLPLVDLELPRRAKI